MKLRVELLLGNMEFSKIDELFSVFESEGANLDKVPINKEHKRGFLIKKYLITIGPSTYEVRIYSLSMKKIKAEIICKYENNKLKSVQKFGEFLSKFKEVLGKNKIQFSVVSNELSNYFSQRLYPLFQNYELKLRKIFVLALAPLEDDEIIKRIKKETEGKIDFTNIRTTDRIEELGIGELHELVFEINLNPIHDLFDYFEDYEMKNESELKRLIKSSFPVTIWDRYFSNFIDVKSGESIVRSSYQEVRNSRNDVMHFHTISYRKFNKIEKMLKSSMRV